MLNELALGLLVVAAVFIVLAPQPEPVLLMPEPRTWWLGRRRARHAQETLEEANTIDWLVKVKLAADEIPIAERRDGTVVTFRPSDSAENIHARLSRPPWEPAAAPEVIWNEMTGPPGKSIILPAPVTIDDIALQQYRDALDRALSPVPEEPEPEPLPEPEERRPWQPGDPADTIVRGIKAITAEDLGEWEKGLPRYGDQED